MTLSKQKKAQTTARWPSVQLGKVTAAADRPPMIRYRNAGEGLKRQQGKGETLGF
jgi:hypothetical protein